MFSRQLVSVFLRFYFFFSAVDANTHSQIPLHTEPQCVDQPYKVHILSTHTPLIIYIEDFVSTSERDELLDLAEPTYSAATVYSQDIYSGNISLEVSPSFRESQTAFIEDTPLVQCIKHRAASFQGVPVERLEGLQVVKYPINGYYNTHVDWIGDHCVDELCQKTGDRETSFFVYLQADCKGGATEFSEMALPGGVDEELWCKFLDCNDADGNRDGNKQASDGNGTGVGGEGERTLKFRPKAGNAIFWENLDGFGQGIWKVAHAGMPVIEGTKIGMNIWTRERAPGDYHGPIRHREKDVIVDFEEITVPVLEKSWEELGFDEVENIGMVEEKFGDSA